MARTNSSDQRTLAIITHILGILTGFIGPLIVMLVAKDKQTKNHARNALNWQLSTIIYFIISFILILILIGILFIVAIAVLNIIFCIMAAIKASEGKLWKYPLTIQFFKTK